MTDPKIYLASPFNSEGGQWWLVATSEQEAIDHMQGNWPDDKFIAEECDPSMTFGHVLSLDPSANDERKTYSAADYAKKHVEEGGKVPDTIYAGGGGPMLARTNNAGKSNTTFIYNNLGKKLDTKADTFKFNGYDDVEIDIQFGGGGATIKHGDFVITMIKGEVYMAGNQVTVNRKTKGCTFIIYDKINEHDDPNNVRVYCSLYLFRNGTIADPKLTRSEYKALSRFIENTVHFDSKRDPVIEALKAERDDSW